MKKCTTKTEKLWSEKLTWAFASGEQKKCLNLFVHFTLAYDKYCLKTKAMISKAFNFISIIEPVRKAIIFKQL